MNHVERRVPLSHSLSREVIRATRGLGWINVDAALLQQRGQLASSSPGHSSPLQLLTAEHRETHALCTQMGLHSSMSPFLALAQKGRPTTP